MLSKKDIEELATGAVKRYFNTCNLVSPQIQENDKTPDWDGELNLYENKKDIRKNYIGSLRIQVKGKEVPKFKDKETFPVETVFLKNARNEGFVFFVVEVMTDGKSKIFYKKMAPIEIRGELASIEQQQKTKNIQFEPLSMDKPWIEVELKAFLLDCIKQKSFASKGQVCIEKFGETEITIKASNKKVILSMINKRLSNLSIHKSVLNILNIKTPINYKTFTEEDDFSMRQLYKALIEHKAIGLTNPQDIFKIRIANINVLLVCQSDNNKKFYLDNAFASPLIKVMQNSDVSPFQVPIFSFLGQKGYVLFDNIPYNRIIEIYNECNLKDSRVIIQANLDLLQILKAYDELKQLGHLEKSKHTIKAAQSLSKWLLENERENSMIALHQLNSLQITKRQRAFTEDEINLLLQLSQNNSDMVRAGAFLLLGKIDVAQFIIQQFPEDEKTRFMEFPIAIFIKGTNC